MYGHFGNQYVKFTENYETIYLNLPVIMLLVVYPINTQSFHKDIFVTVLITALFIRTST